MNELSKIHAPELDGDEFEEEAEEEVTIKEYIMVDGVVIPKPKDTRTPEEIEKANRKENNEFIKNQIGKYLAEAVLKYFRVPENRAKFEAYYREKYGKEYVWKTLADEYYKNREVNADA